MSFLKRTFAALALSVMATAAVANPATVERVTEGLITAGMAIELEKQCADVDLRMLRGLNYLQGLKNHLKGLGYSNAEIDAYIDNDAEKDRLEVIARERLASLGVRESDRSSYCRVARSQIEAGTALGRLLR